MFFSGKSMNAKNDFHTTILNKNEVVFLENDNNINHNDNNVSSFITKFEKTLNDPEQNSTLVIQPQFRKKRNTRSLSMSDVKDMMIDDKPKNLNKIIEKNEINDDEMQKIDDTLTTTTTTPNAINNNEDNFNHIIKIHTSKYIPPSEIYKMLKKNNINAEISLHTTQNNKIYNKKKKHKNKNVISSKIITDATQLPFDNNNKTDDNNIVCQNNIETTISCQKTNNNNTTCSNNKIAIKKNYNLKYKLKILSTISAIIFLPIPYINQWIDVTQIQPLANIFRIPFV